MLYKTVIHPYSHYAQAIREVDIDEDEYKLKPLYEDTAWNMHFMVYNVEPCHPHIGHRAFILLEDGREV